MDPGLLCIGPKEERNLPTLRLPLSADVPLYHSHLCDPEVSVWLEDRLQYPIGIEEVSSFVLGAAWARWAIEFDGRFVGMTGLEDFDPNRGLARFFIVIGDRTCWGKGLGQAVINQVVSRGFRDRGLRKIVSNYLHPHIASQKIHDRAKFVTEGRLRRDVWRCGDWVDTILVSRFREE